MLLGIAVFIFFAICFLAGVAMIIIGLSNSGENFLVIFAERIWKKCFPAIPFMAVAFLVAISTAAWTGEIVQMPKHGTLWGLAEACGQSGKNWPAIAAKNPWLTVRVAKGEKIPVVYPGQPIVLPDGWQLIEDEEPSEDSRALAALGEEFWEIGRNHPIPTMIIIFLLAAIITAKDAISVRRERAAERE
jgi:hypothetical protein